MPPLKGKVPSYCLHKRSGRAVVRLNGKGRRTFYLVSCYESCFLLQSKSVSRIK